MIRKKKLFKKINEIEGFGLVDAILSITLLAGIISYGLYFSSLRLNTVHSSNLIRSINKEIERDIERLKRDLWSTYYDENSGKYIVSESTCSASDILNMPSWQIDLNSSDRSIQSWRPGLERSKVFSGQKVLITRQLDLQKPVAFNYGYTLNNSIASVNYRVQWGDKDKHWLSIEFVPEYHSWCEQEI